MRRKRGGLAAICMALGLLLIGSALALALYNRWDEQRAAAALDPLLSQLRPETVTAAPQPTWTPPPAESPVPPPAAASAAPAAPGALHEDVEEVTDDGQTLSTVTIDGVEYVGILTIPSLGLELPICGQCDDAKLKISPCRYAGDLDDLVIAGHNYICHFAYLGRLRPGDQVQFTTVEGQVYSYEVEVLETLSPLDVEEMTAGDWPLTLFTCTLGSQYRVTVRCSRI